MKRKSKLSLRVLFNFMHGFGMTNPPLCNENFPTAFLEKFKAENPNFKQATLAFNLNINLELQIE